MKKLGLSVMPLMAMSLLASCGGDDPVEQVEFLLSSDQPTTVVEKSATVYVDWKPTEHAIKFSSFTFTADPVKENTISFDSTSDFRPMPVKITFNDYILEPINGTLNFTYEDVTAKTTGSSSIDVTIPKPEEDPFYVTKEEYEDATSLKDVEFLQTELTFQSGDKNKCEFFPTVYYMNAEITETEKFVVKNDDSYSKYTRGFSDDEFKYELATADDFKIPQSFADINPKMILDDYEIVYGENLQYDSNKGVYVANVDDQGDTVKIEIKFVYKKAANLSISVNGDIDQTINYSYNEKTPLLPCTLDFSSETCELKKNEESDPITKIIVNNGADLNYIITPKDGYTLPLANQIDFKITGTTDDFEGEHSYNPDTGAVSIALTDNVTITCQSEIDPTLTKEEFDKAITFEGVQYLQVDETIIIDPETPIYPKVIKMSPNVIHALADGDEFYDETYCRKYEIDDSAAYDECYRDDPANGFIFEHNVSEEKFMTPQTYSVGGFEKNLLDSIKELLGDDYYSSFAYVKKDGVYKAEFDGGTIVLEFDDNKKVVGYEFDIESSEYYDVTGTLTYLESVPEYPIEHDEIDIPNLGRTEEFTLYAQDGKMYIDITNAKDRLAVGSVLYAAYCNLSDESSISPQTPKVFSSVEASLGETTLYIFPGTESVDVPPTVINAEYWQASLPDIIPDDTLYIVLTINDDYVSSETGRVAKQNYTGDVSCIVHNIDDGDDTNTVKIEIDYDSITEQPAI